MKPQHKPFWLFVLLLGLFPSLHSVVRLWQGESLDVLGLLGVAAFPLLAWAWWRFFSRFGGAARCSGGCLPPTGHDN